MVYSKEKSISLAKNFNKNDFVNFNSNEVNLDPNLQDISLERNQFVRAIFLTLKGCFFLLSIVSLFKIGYTSKIRIVRLREIKNSYISEISRYRDLSSRFDDLFSFKGEQRFMKDQDQIIARDILRVIWR